MLVKETLGAPIVPSEAKQELFQLKAHVVFGLGFWGRLYGLGFRG